MAYSTDWDRQTLILRAHEEGYDKGVAAEKDNPSSTKPSNPKDVLGVRKLPFSVIPFPVMWEIALGMLEGALKYGRHNYRVVGVRASVYVDAAFRHVTAFWEGEDTDPDSRLSHITKAITSLVVLRDGMLQGNWVDDRPPRSKPGLLKGYNLHVDALLTEHPLPVEPYTAE